MGHSDRLGMPTRLVTSRILAVWAKATDADKEAGATWYDDGQKIIDRLSAQSGASRETVAAMMAHLSPRTRWVHTVSGTTSLVLTGMISGHMTANVNRAKAAWQSDDPLGTLKGPKTRRFAANLLGDTESVTIDIWALRVALGDIGDEPNILRKPGTYEAIEHCYRLAARRVGVHPTTMQATTWIVARNGRVN